MLGSGWLTLRQVRAALQNGRLEEAQQLLNQPSVRGHKKSWDLLAQLTSDTSLLAGVIPAAGAVAGNFGSFFRTSMQLANPTASIAQGRIVFHPFGVAGANDPFRTFSLQPFTTATHPDIVTEMGLSGLVDELLRGEFGDRLPAVRLHPAPPECRLRAAGDRRTSGAGDGGGQLGGRDGGGRRGGASRR